MAQKTLPPSAEIAILGAIGPAALTVGARTTGWVPIADFGSFMAIVTTGVLGTDATVDAKIEQATDATGAGAKDIEGAAIAQLTKAEDDNKQAIIELGAEDLDLANDFTHIRLTVEVGAATSDCGAVLLGVGPRYAPASGHDAASVAEIVTVGA